MDKQGNTTCTIIALVLTNVFAPIDSVWVSQNSSSSNCVEGALNVNCSYLGIVYSYSSYTDNFTCPVCCNTGICCQRSTNITLRLHPRLNKRKTNVTYVVSREPVQLLSAGEEWINSSSFFNDRLSMFKGFNGSYNNLRKLPCFDKWISLEWVDLSSNFISFLTNPFCFGNLSVLTTLSLRNNMLHVIFPTVFNHLKGLRYLYINENPTIVDWSFLNEAVHIRMVDIRGSCNRSYSAVSYLSMPCVKNMSLIHDNSTCVQESVDKSGGCNLSVIFPTTSNVLSPIVPCESIRPLYSTSPIMSVTNTVQGGTTKKQICVSFANTAFNFLSSGETCIWLPILILVCLGCSVLSVVSLLQRRALTKYQVKRYSQRLFKYSPQSSRDEHGLQMQCDHEDSERPSAKCKN
ncbi:Plant intracellular Ras-group-related LRR protein 9 [Holothuria leucospilota]|uniref:Plant intracellular Ras-group-related LRR protein 9 n=1 Tax=Holothuria leucospilota TaxID=206669 RepID=A0A9Q1C486_HOLLE|nr:Plant intracellular Ras-group-related LRR protein 9 [Holothuria leucospilota]